MYIYIYIYNIDKHDNNNTHNDNMSFEVTGGRPDDKCQLDSESGTGDCAASRPALGRGRFDSESGKGSSAPDKSQLDSVSGTGNCAASRPALDRSRFDSASSMGSYAKSQPGRGKGKFNSTSSMGSWTTDAATPRTSGHIESNGPGSTNCSTRDSVREARSILLDSLPRSRYPCEEVLYKFEM